MPLIDQEYSNCDDYPSTMRIDKLLYYLRFAKSRSIARALCESGYIRHDGIRVEGGRMRIQIGSIITMPRGDTVIIFELLHIPKRRGPAKEAMQHYKLVKAQN